MGGKDKQKSKKKDIEKVDDKKSKKDKKLAGGKRSKEVEIENAAEEKKKDRMTKRELKRLKNQKLGNAWKDEMVKFEKQLEVFGVKIKVVKGDGNCLFRTISDHMEGNENHHYEYRKQIIQFMIMNREYFEPFIEDDEKFDDYIRDMQKEAVWGGNLELQAFSMLFQRNVVVHILDQPCYIITSSPDSKTLHCSYHQGVFFYIINFIKRSIIIIFDGKMI